MSVGLTRSFTVDFIGIGAPKCGTTWLFYALGQHPRICLSEPKEINYFNREDFWRTPLPGTAGLPVLNPNHSQPLSWYRRHYGHCDAQAIKGEFSPSYMYDRAAPASIQRSFPDVKLLVALRNPIDKLHSTYWSRKHYRKREGRRTFAQAIDEDPRYVAQGFYAKHLRRYLQVFDRSRFKVVLLEDIVERPDETVRDLFRFLNVDAETALRLDRVPRNEAKKSTLVPIEPLLRWSARLLVHRGTAALSRLVRQTGIKRIAIRLSTSPHPRQPLEAATRERLYQLFRDDIRELEDLLERDLSSWR